MCGGWIDTLGVAMIAVQHFLGSYVLCFNGRAIEVFPDLSTVPA